MSRFRLSLTLDAEREPVELGAYDSPEDAMAAARDDRTRTEEWGQEVDLPDGDWELYQRGEGEPRSWTKWLRPDGPRSEAYYTIHESWEG